MQHVDNINADIDSQSDISRMQLLVVGHVTCDIFENHQQLGGAGAYAARTAAAFSYRTFLVTASPDSPLLKPLQDDINITIHHKKCSEFTTFSLNNGGTQRILSLISRAPDLTPEDIPEAARNIPLAYIGPVIGECGREIIESLNSEYIVVGAQGWLRSVDKQGIVVPHMLPEAEMPPNIQVIVFSERDFPDAEATADHFARSVKIVALTRGAKGVTLLSEGKKIDLPAVKTQKEVDPTGAGDAFGVIFGCELYNGKDIVDSAYSAMWAAARVVEGRGMGNLTRDLVNRQFRQIPG